MIRALSSYFSSVPPVFIDGLLYCLIALFGAMIATFGAEEAPKYVNPNWLYWIKESSKWSLALATAIKMFRDTSYSDHRAKKNGDTTTFVVKP